MPALKITAPRPTAFLLQQFSLRKTELEKVREAGNQDALIFFDVATRITRHNFVDEFAIRDVVRLWEHGIEARKLEKLPGRSRNDKTVMRVDGLDFFRVMRGLPFCVVEHIFPNQMGAIGKRVL